MNAPITLRVLEGPRRTRDDGGWEHFAYTVELERDGVSFTSPWRAGLAHTASPAVADVLEAMLSDTSSVENAAGDFEEWAADYGYDPDSRRAEAIFHACTAQAAKLRELLGDDFDAAVFPPAGLDPEQVAERLADGRELTPDNDEEG